MTLQDGRGIVVDMTAPQFGDHASDSGFPWLTRDFDLLAATQDIELSCGADRLETMRAWTKLEPSSVGHRTAVHTIDICAQALKQLGIKFE